MRRNVKKALAFTLAAVTAVANLSVGQAVNAAEYEEAKEIFAPKYDAYAPCDDGCVYANYGEVTDGESYSTTVTDAVLVDSDGNEIAIEVKDSSGKALYKRVSPVNEYPYGEGYVVLIGTDDSETILFEDGTMFGKGAGYKSIMPLEVGSAYVVEGDDYSKVVDNTGKVLADNVFSGAYTYSYMYFWGMLGNYYVVEKSGNDSEGNWTSEMNMIDSSFKVANFDFKDGKVYDLISDKYLAAYDAEGLELYDANLSKVTLDLGITTSEKPTEEVDEPVLYDYLVNGCYDYYGKDVMCVSAILLYYDGVEESTEFFEKYYDIATLKEVALNEGDTYTSEVENTDLVYKFGATEDVTGFFDAKGNKLYDFYDIAVQIAQDNGMNTEDWMVFDWEDYAGVEGDLYVIMEVTGFTDEGEEVETVSSLKFSKASGYALEDMEYLDKGISYIIYALTGGYVLNDGKAYFDGKWYDKSSALQFMYMGDGYMYSIASDTDNDGEYDQWKLYDQEKSYMATSNYKIVDAIDSGLYITHKHENGNYYYGCGIAKKVVSATEEVMEEIADAKEGDEVTVTIEKNEPIKKEAFEALKGKDIDLVVTTPSGIKWTINGKNITGTALKDIDLTVDIVKDVVPAKAIDAWKFNGEKIELSLAHSGDFGFTAELKINVKAENTGKFANLFYYNPTTAKLEFQQCVKVDDKGDAAFNYTHASDYVIVLSDMDYSSVAPPTGDTVNMSIALVGLVAALGVVAVSMKKKEA